MPISTKELVDAHEGIHGNWADNARISREIKAALRSGPAWDRMTQSQKEAVEMIAFKLSRIVAGNPDYDDHWDDIGGYARLGKHGTSKSDQ